MKFNIDPPSAHANSYLDIKFILEFDKAEQAQFSFTNSLTNDLIEIISVSDGIILNGTVAQINQSKSLEGYFNLFPKDKTNINLLNITAVKISCNAKFTRKEITQEIAECTFYNESMSLDADVIPIDVIMRSEEIDLSKYEPLKLSIISNIDKTHELCIKSVLGNSKYTFEVYCKKGRTDIEIPPEILSHELKIRKTSKFRFYFIRFEGINFARQMNRKYIPIPKSDITFIGKYPGPQSQTRLGPVDELPPEFVLSDRYFVHTLNRFSSFGSRPEKIDLMINHGRFSHELQDLKVKSIPNSFKKQEIVPQKINIPKASVDQIKFSQQFSSVNTKSVTRPTKTTAKTGDCGCSRKKKNV